jgi:hypothetical protein
VPDDIYQIRAIVSAWIASADIGTSTVQSRALAGLANNTLVVCMPGSTGVCSLAWEGLLKEQLDSRPLTLSNQAVLLELYLAVFFGKVTQQSYAQYL